MRFSIRRTAGLAAITLVFLILAGATYQGVATAIERRQFPHPGKLVDVGGHQLHLYCTGKGQPTVVLEAPAAGMSAAWGWVQPRVAATTRVCSYDRAGMGWSEAGDGPFDPATVPEQLHTLLARGGEAGPYVMVGQGLGAAFMSLYGSRFQDEVAALVLIDPPADAREATQVTSLARFAAVSPWLARTGLLRAARMISKNADGLPEPSAGAFSSFLNRPDHLTRAARELSRWETASDLARTATGEAERVTAEAVPAEAGAVPAEPGNTSARHPRPVVKVDIAGPDRVAFLLDESHADAAAHVILSTVERVRATR